MNQEFNREDSFGWLIAALHTSLAQELDKLLKEHGLSIGLWPTLMCLWEEEGVTQREIALKARVENSTTTRTLDKLESLGLTERRPDPNSRRSYRIFLTDKAKALKDEITQLPLQVNEKYLAVLTPEEREQLITLLKKVAGV